VIHEQTQYGGYELANLDLIFPNNTAQFHPIAERLTVTDN
jgi:hypothetical protein